MSQTQDSFTPKSEEEYLQEMEQEAPKTTHFVKFTRDGETKKLEFLIGEDPETHQRYMTWITKKGFNPGDKDRIQARFTVIDGSEGDLQGFWDTSPATQTLVMRRLHQGEKVLSVERVGTGTKTRYNISKYRD